MASINYRLAPAATWPAQLYDCKAAIRWVRAHAADYGIDPNKIGAFGESAGGNLVSLLGTTMRHPELEGNEGNPGVSSGVQVACDYFGPVDLLDSNPAFTKPQSWVLSQFLSVPLPLVNYPDKVRLGSPFSYVDNQACPFFIAQGDADTAVPMEQSVRFDAALKKAGVASVLCIVPGGRHNLATPAASAQADAAMEAFLQQYLPTPK